MVRTKLAENVEKRQNRERAICCCCFVWVLYLFQCFFLLEYAFIGLDPPPINHYHLSVYGYIFFSICPFCYFRVNWKDEITKTNSSAPLFLFSQQCKVLT